MAFNNKVVFITGAGSGIGKATALHFAEQSATLSLVDLHGENLKETSENCEKFGCKVLKIVADLTKDIEVKNVIDTTVEELGKINVVVMCAGIYKRTSILDSNLMENFDQIMAVNLRSAVVATSFAAPALIKTKGCIINIASVSAILAPTDHLGYSVSKAGVSHFMRSIALELATKGVRVVNVLPGAVRTNLLLNSGLAPEEVEETWDLLSKANPLKHLVLAEDVAALIGFLASDWAKSITGSDFIVDSGIILSGPHKKFTCVPVRNKL